MHVKIPTDKKSMVASDETRLKIDRAVKPAVAVIGGTITLVLSGGTASPILASFAVATGSMSVAGGSAQLIMVAAGSDQSQVDQVPTSYLGATMGVMAIRSM